MKLHPKRFFNFPPDAVQDLRWEGSAGHRMPDGPDSSQVLGIFAEQPDLRHRAGIQMLERRPDRKVLRL